MELSVDRFALCITLWFFATLPIHCHTTDDQTVTIATGSLIGSAHQSAEGRPFDAYLGIPYAKQPTDQLRFKPPEPAEPWTGVLNATQDGSQCPQIEMGMNKNVVGHEDCLFANVYRPRMDDKSLAVLVYIHGGGFNKGTGRMQLINPHKIMDEDIILVTINYRLGVLGFLSSEDENAFGNYGLLDQVLALRWVQQNIRHFGGDPDRVTIFGVSSGGASVAFLVVSPLAKGLFRAAIAQSGSTIGYWSIQRNPLFWAKKIAEGVNCPTDDSLKMVNCLTMAPANDLVLAENSQEMTYWFPLIMQPVVEVPGGSGFLPEDPLVLLTEGRIGSKVPYITGVTKDEGFFFALLLQMAFKTKGQDFFDEEFPMQYLSQIVPVKPPKETRLRKISKFIQQEYFRTDQDLNDPTAFTERLSEFMADVKFTVAADVTLRLMSNAGVKTYAYKYTHWSKHSLLRMITGLSSQVKHVNHGDDAFLHIGYSPAEGQEVMSSADVKMSKILNHMCANFAQTLNPSFTDKSIKDEPRVTWLAYDPAKPTYLELRLNPSMKEGIMSNRTKLWTETIRSLAQGDLYEREEL